MSNCRGAYYVLTGVKILPSGRKTYIVQCRIGGRVGMATSLPILAKHVFVKTVKLADDVKPDTMGENILTTLPHFQWKGNMNPRICVGLFFDD